MKKYAVQTYVCPFSGEPLSLVSIQEQALDLSREQIATLERRGIDPGDASVAVKEGFLYSEKGGYWFPIINFIPIFLDFPVDLHSDFKHRHAGSHDLLNRLSIPDGTPRQGELLVQMSFTREWALIDLDVISFALTPEQRDFFVSLELDWPETFLDRDPLRVLEVGCGSGFESASLSRITKGLIFGFDLNLALVQKGHLLAGDPFINNAISSLFRLPVRRQNFDLVYSSGVIHHTYSTRAALEEIVRYQKDDGLLYIWIYAKEDSASNFEQRVKWLLEDLLRPTIARLPRVAQASMVKAMALIHYRKWKKVGRHNRDLWRFKDSEHYIRDRWTPLYAHRQSFNETMCWFSEMGMEYRLIDPKRYQDFMGAPMFGIGIRGVHRTPELQRRENTRAAPAARSTAERAMHHA
jgi:SAM-dependent methyltransferase/uncharacterized protein YbaR (Trm112 family)